MKRSFLPAKTESWLSSSSPNQSHEIREFSPQFQLIADRIEARMNECGLTRQKFASLMDVQPSIITRWLSGTHNFTLSTIFSIERKLTCNIIFTNQPVKKMHIHMRLTVLSQKTTLPNFNELASYLNAYDFATPVIDPQKNICVTNLGKVNTPQIKRLQFKG